MNHDALCPRMPSPRAQHEAGIPYPFSDLPPLDGEMTDVRLADTLETVLAQLAGLTQALKMTSLDDVPHDQLHAAHGLLAAHAQAAQTIFNRWIDAKRED